MRAIYRRAASISSFSTLPHPLLPVPAANPPPPTIPSPPPSDSLPHSRPCEQHRDHGASRQAEGSSCVGLLEDARGPLGFLVRRAILSTRPRALPRWTSALPPSMMPLSLSTSGRARTRSPRCSLQAPLGVFAGVPALSRLLVLLVGGVPPGLWRVALNSTRSESSSLCPARCTSCDEAKAEPFWARASFRISNISLGPARDLHL